MAESPSFLRRYVFSTDHKVIGIQYIVTGLVMAVIGAALAVLIRMQLAFPGHQWELLGRLMPTGFPQGYMTPEFYIAMVTMHGTIMVFFFVSYVLVSGFGNYLIPLQIGRPRHGVPVPQHACRTGSRRWPRWSCCCRFSSRGAPPPPGGPPTRR